LYFKSASIDEAKQKHLASKLSEILKSWNSEQVEQYIKQKAQEGSDSLGYALRAIFLGLLIVKLCLDVLKILMVFHFLKKLICFLRLFYQFNCSSLFQIIGSLEDESSVFNIFDILCRLMVLGEINSKQISPLSAFLLGEVIKSMNYIENNVKNLLFFPGN
jgi:hypothetical protein